MSTTTTNPLKGIVTEINDLGIRVIYWHYSSDPVKDGEWIARASAGIPGGIQSDDWQQEMELNHHVAQGRLTFYAFSRTRNCIDDIPCDVNEFRNWKHFLSADYGGGAAPTCWLFWAENRQTSELIIYDSIYVHTSGKQAWPEVLRSAGPVSRMIHEKAKYWFGISQASTIDLLQYYDYAVGDPTGRGFALEYAASATPVIVGAPEMDKSLPRINDIMAGESRVNSYLTPAFLCCANDKGLRLPIYAESAECPICGKLRRGQPRLRIVRRRCPELVVQLETLRKRVPLRPELEQSSLTVKLPDHAADACRYGAMTCSPSAVDAKEIEKEEAKMAPLDKKFYDFQTRYFARIKREKELEDAGIEFDETMDPALYEAPKEIEGDWLF